MRPLLHSKDNSRFRAHWPTLCIHHYYSLSLASFKLILHYTCYGHCHVSGSVDRPRTNELQKKKTSNGRNFPMTKGCVGGVVNNNGEYINEEKVPDCLVFIGRKALVTCLQRWLLRWYLEPTWNFIFSREQFEMSFKNKTTANHSYPLPDNLT